MKPSGLFDFESDYKQTLHCIPMVARLKLDLAGLKLTLKTWTRLPEAERRHLVERPCDTADQIAAFRDRLLESVGAHGGDPPSPLPAAPLACDGDAPPAELVAVAAAHGFRMSITDWGRLTRLQRFALTKLAHPNHETGNFAAAAREFALPRADTA